MLTLPAELLTLIVAFAPPEHHLAGENANPLLGCDNGGRRSLCGDCHIQRRVNPKEVVEISRSLLARLTEEIWYAA